MKQPILCKRGQKFDRFSSGGVRYTDSVKRLANIDTEFSIFRWPTNSDVWVGCRLERPKAVADDECCRTKAAERFVDQAWPGDQAAMSIVSAWSCHRKLRKVEKGLSQHSPDGIDAKSPDEARFEAEFAQNPVRMSQACQGVSTKVCGLQARGSCSRNVQSVLEVLIERVNKTVGEALLTIRHVTSWIARAVSYP